MYETGFNDGYLAAMAVLAIIGVLVLIDFILYHCGRDSAQQEAEEQAVAAKKEYEARIAVAGLQGMQGKALRSELNGLSREHLQNVASFVEEQ